MGLFDKPAISDKIIGISVAGVGSSAIGAVALARDVAATTNGSVAAVVSGYGVDDVMNEALGGWCFLRETNRLEFDIEQVNNALAKVSNLPAIVTSVRAMDSIGSGPDLVTLKSMIRASDPQPEDRPDPPKHLKNLKWLVGHSKGNLLISSAISELVMENSEFGPELGNVNIVFFSALSALPGNIGHQRQIIGDMDVLGWTNSRINIAHTLVHGAMHHTNRSIPFHMDVPAQLTQIQQAALPSADTR
ncbi:MAG: hypothetical protein ABSC06_34440 [Rhodopila sp.]